MFQQSALPTSSRFFHGSLTLLFYVISSGLALRADNLVTNGSFESLGPDVTFDLDGTFGVAWDGTNSRSVIVEGWTFRGDPSSEWVNINYGDSSALNWGVNSVATEDGPRLWPISAQDGLVFLRMDTLGAIGQSLTTIPGQDYLLTFYVGIDTDFVSTDQGVTLILDGLGINTYTVSPTAPGITWTQFSYQFTATSGLTDLAFAGVSDSSTLKYAMLDNVGVVSIPEPSAFLLFGTSSLIGLLFSRRR